MPFSRTAAARLYVASMAAAARGEGPGPMKTSFFMREGCLRVKFMAMMPPIECETRVAESMLNWGLANIPARSSTKLSIVTGEDALVGVRLWPSRS